MNPFSILMLAFSGMLLLYAGLLALTKDYKLIPRSCAVSPKDPGAYAAAFARMIALVAMAPLTAALFGWIRTELGVAMLLIDFPLCIYVGTHFFRGL